MNNRVDASHSFYHRSRIEQVALDRRNTKGDGFASTYKSSAFEPRRDEARKEPGAYQSSSAGH
jgi:hypothetical protein